MRKARIIFVSDKRTSILISLKLRGVAGVSELSFSCVLEVIVLGRIEGAVGLGQNGAIHAN